MPHKLHFQTRVLHAKLKDIKKLFFIKNGHSDVFNLEGRYMRRPKSSNVSPTFLYMLTGKQNSDKEIRP